MGNYYICSYRPCYPEKGVHIEAIKEKDYARDSLPATLTALFFVEHVTSKAEAIAVCVERLAGKNVCVRQII